MEKRKAVRPFGPVVDAGQEEARVKPDAGAGEATLEISDRLDCLEIGIVIDLVKLIEGPE